VKTSLIKVLLIGLSFLLNLSISNAEILSSKELGVPQSEALRKELKEILLKEGRRRQREK